MEITITKNPKPLKKTPVLNTIKVPMDFYTRRKSHLLVHLLGTINIINPEDVRIKVLN